MLDYLVNAKMPIIGKLDTVLNIMMRFSLCEYISRRVQSYTKFAASTWITTLDNASAIAFRLPLLRLIKSKCKANDQE